MTQEQIIQFGKAIDSRMVEHFDGYVVVGFIAGTSQPIMLTSPTDPKTRLALNSLLASAIAPMPVAPQHAD